MPLFAVGDVVWQAAIAGIVTVFGGLFTLIIAWMQFKTKSAVETTAAEAAIKVEGVKKATETAAMKADQVMVKAKETSDIANRKLDDLASVAAKTHTLVNSNMAVQLELNAKVTRRLADLTKDPEDQKAAELADRMFEEHQNKQADVDKQSKPKGSAD